MISRLRRAAPYRLGRIYRALAAAWPIRVGDATRSAPAARYVTFGGESHATMLRANLASLRISWKCLPEVWVVSDGSLDLARFRKRMGRAFDSVKIVEWAELVPLLPWKESEFLRTFAEREPMGRKMIALLASALSMPTLYSDCDVLWFRMPSKLTWILEGTSPQCLLSEDIVSAYDPRLVPEVFPELSASPFLCAGVALARGDVASAADVLGSFEFLAAHGVALSEQTTLAVACRRITGSAWSREEIALETEDRHHLGASFRGKDWAARHYVGQVRHLFWRDSFDLLSRGAVDREAAP